jgi:SanA protein
MKKRARQIAIVSLAAVLTGVTAVAVWSWIQWRYDRLVWTDLAAVPERPVAIVFGAGVRSDGQLTPMLQDRVDSAIALYRAGKVGKLLMSGDNRFVHYDEPGRMYDYALARGVPAKDVTRDYAGRRTYDTCYRARAIFGVKRAVLVTQRFHLPRALFTCRNLGVDAIGFSADRRIYWSGPFYEMRDAVATLRAWWDVKVAKPLPVLGQQEDLGV